MINIDQINKEFRDLVSLSYPGLVVIKADQPNAPLPTDPTTGAKVSFATVHVSEDGHRGSADYIKVNNASGEDLDYTTCILSILTIEINFYVDDGTLNARQLASGLPLFMKTVKAIQQLKKAKIGIMSSTPARDLSAVENGFYEERAIVSFTANSMSDRTDLVEEIKEANIQGVVETPPPETYDIDINITQN